MKYIVTGGLGFIGSNLSRHLVSKGHEVVIIDNLSNGKETNIRDFKNHDKLTVVNGNISNRQLLLKHFCDADGVFHEAALTSVSLSCQNPELTNEINVSGTLTILTAARECGVKKLVFASSASVYGDRNTSPQNENMKPEPQSPYAVSKLASEEYCSVFSKLYDFPTICLRYFNVYGPRQDPGSEYAAAIPRFVVQGLNHMRPTIFGDGLQSRDFVFIDDVVQANVLAMEGNTQGVFNIGSGRSVSVNELVSTISDLVKNKNLPTYLPTRPGDIKESLADISKAKDQLHYNPKFSLVTGLKKTIDWYKNRD
jgi:UDP-glucose 4-epimerase